MVLQHQEHLILVAAVVLFMETLLAMQLLALVVPVLLS